MLPRVAVRSTNNQAKCSRPLNNTETNSNRLQCKHRHTRSTTQRFKCIIKTNTNIRRIGPADRNLKRVVETKNKCSQTIDRRTYIIHTALLFDRWLLSKEKLRRFFFYFIISCFLVFNSSGTNRTLREWEWSALFECRRMQKKTVCSHGSSREQRRTKAQQPPYQCDVWTGKKRQRRREYGFYYNVSACIIQSIECNEMRKYGVKSENIVSDSLSKPTALYEHTTNPYLVKKTTTNIIIHIFFTSLTLFLFLSFFWMTENK